MLSNIYQSGNTGEQPPNFMAHCTKPIVPCCFNGTPPRGKQNFYHTHHQDNYGTDGNEPQIEWE